MRLNEVEKKPFLGWVEKVRRDKNKAEPRLVVVTAYRLCLIKKSGVNFSVTSWKFIGIMFLLRSEGTVIFQR